MTISYPLTMPSNLKESSIALYMGNTNGVGTSPYTMTQQVHSYGGDSWGLEVAIDPLYRNEAAPWMAFLAALRGRYGTFLFGPESLSTPLGDGPGAYLPKVNGANQTGYSVVTDTWPNNTEILKAGDIFEIDNRLYMNLTDVTSDGSGNATLDVWPSLRSPADNATIVTNNPVGLFRLNQDSIRVLDVPNTQLFTIAFAAQEAF